jgi:acyl-CoA thioester hydrolase
MPRIKLKERPNYEYAHSLKVRVTDINYGGHLGNEALLELIHEARAAFLQKLGFNTVMKGEDLLGLIIADIAVNFKAEAFAGDQLMIDCQIGELTPKSFRLFHRIRREKDVAALVETGLIAYDYQDRKIASLPEEFTQGLDYFRKKKVASIE